MKHNEHSDPLIRARGIGARQDGRWLVRDVDMEIRRNEIVTLIGPNGAGKTTVAKLIAGARALDRGEITRVPGLHVGYAPQKLTLEPSLPLKVARLLTLTSRHTRKEVDWALDRVGILHLRDRSARTLSGGELQRALLARAIIRKPNLLVLDEPAQGVDFTGEAAIHQLIQELRDQMHCGILLVSHDLHFVMAATDTVLCLNTHVCCSGAPQSVAEHPEYMQIFGDRAMGTTAIYHHHHDHEHLPDGRIRGKERTPEDKNSQAHHVE